MNHQKFADLIAHVRRMGEISLPNRETGEWMVVVLPRLRVNTSPYEEFASSWMCTLKASGLAAAHRLLAQGRTTDGINVLADSIISGGEDEAVNPTEYCEQCEVRKMLAHRPEEAIPRMHAHEEAAREASRSRRVGQRLRSGLSGLASTTIAASDTVADATGYYWSNPPEPPASEGPSVLNGLLRRDFLD